MVGGMLILKMLHCRAMQFRGTHNGEESSSDEDSDTDFRPVKREKDASNICRVCLKEGSIYIFRSTNIDIPKALNTFAGIEISVDDPHPKFLCQSCYTLLEGAISLRRTAQKSIKKLMPSDDQNEDTITHDDFSVEKKDTQKKPRHCVRCNLTFDTFQDYNEHRMSDEHENMRHTCPICEKSFKAAYFKKHVQSHQPGSAYMCDICGKNFLYQGHFSRHRLTHFYQLPYKCSLCPYRGRFPESLKMHMRSHTGERPYQCTECPSRFISKSNLNKHALTHREDHDFKCESCGRGFYTKRELELHSKVEHRGIKEHVCNICGKAFGYRKQMMKHQLKVHKREKLRSGRMPIYLQVESMKQQGQDVDV